MCSKNADKSIISRADRLHAAWSPSIRSPKVALAPLFVILMGTGPEPKIAVALMLAIFPIVIDAVLGLRSVDPDMLNLARAFEP
jgi:ABC-type nitrate/sulfonate/bicarbonate transport system permease component